MRFKLKDYKEEWKDIPGYEGYYKVSNLGNIISCRIFNNNRLPKIRKINHNKITGYNSILLCVNRNNKRIAIHILVAMAFLGHKVGDKKLVIDHINGVKTDNRLENLQILTCRENISKGGKNKTSKYPGVCWHKRDKIWQASIKINGITKFLGVFKSEKDAANAYENAIKYI